MLDPALTQKYSNRESSGGNHDMSARTRLRSSASSDRPNLSLVEILVVAPVVAVLALGALQWS